MTFDKTINFTGDNGRAMQAAVDFVMANGFRITSKTESTLSFTAVNRFHRERNPVAAIGEARITVSGNSISIRGQTRGFRPAAVVRVLSAIAGVTLAAGFAGKFFHHGPEVMAPVIMFDVIFLVVFPFSLIAARRRVERSLDTLLHNLAMLADGAVLREEARIS